MSAAKNKDLVLKLNEKVLAKLTKIADETADNDIGFPRLSEAYIAAILLASMTEDEIRRDVGKTFRFFKKKQAGASDEEASSDPDPDEATTGKPLDSSKLKA